MHTYNNDDVTRCNHHQSKYCLKLLKMFQTKTRYILNVQMEFQHPSDTSEIFRDTFKCILRYNGSSINFRHVFEVSHNSLI